MKFQSFKLIEKFEKDHDSMSGEMCQSEVEVVSTSGKITAINASENFICQ